MIGRRKYCNEFLNPDFFYLNVRLMFIHFILSYWNLIPRNKYSPFLRVRFQLRSSLNCLRFEDQLNIPKRTSQSLRAFWLCQSRSRGIKRNANDARLTTLYSEVHFCSTVALQQMPKMEIVHQQCESI